MGRRQRYLDRANWAGLATVILFLALWELVVVSGLLDYDSLPAPHEVAGGVSELASSGDLVSNLAHTLRVVLVAWALAMIIGVALGLLVGLSDVAWRWTMASIDVLRTLPVVAFVPVALLIYGPSQKAEIVVAVYAAVWPVAINAAGGLRGVHVRLHEVARTMRLSRRDTLRKIVIPATAPALLVGGRVALAIALIVTVVAEMIGNPQGLGYGIVQQQQALQPERMWGYIVIIGAVGVTLNWVLVATVRRALPGAAPQLGAA